MRNLNKRMDEKSFDPKGEGRKASKANKREKESEKLRSTKRECGEERKEKKKKKRRGAERRCYEV